jgi:AcrR family transcriptional regulator
MTPGSFLQDEAAQQLLTESGAMRRGPKQHAREEVDAVQRGRLIAATTATVAEVGYAGLTVAQVIDRAGVSRRTFYELFTDTEDCFLATYGWGLEHVSALVIESYTEESCWREGIRGALATLLGFLDVERGWARLLVVEGVGAGKEVLALRVQTIKSVSVAIEEGRERADEKQPLPLASEVVVGGSLWVIYSHLIDRPNESLVDLHGALMAMIVLPYLGMHEARKELTTPFH